MSSDISITSHITIHVFQNKFIDIRSCIFQCSIYKTLLLTTKIQKKSIHGIKVRTKLFHLCLSLRNNAALLLLSALSAEKYPRKHTQSARQQ